MCEIPCIFATADDKYSQHASIQGQEGFKWFVSNTLWTHITATHLLPQHQGNVVRRKIMIMVWTHSGSNDFNFESTFKLEGYCRFKEMTDKKFSLWGPHSN